MSSNGRNQSSNSGNSGTARSKAAQQQKQLETQRKKERRLLAMVAIGLVAVVIIGGVALQAWRTNRAPQATESTVASFAPVTIANNKPIVLGQAGAPVTLSLYEDFHCLHCAEFEESFGPTVTAAQNEGRLSVELYPMSFIDQGSFAASNAMACAAEAGFAQNYYRGLFANHTLQWSDEQLLELASKVGANPTEEFTTCVTGKKQMGWVESINATATANGVASTPTLFLNGNPVATNGLTPANLKTMIDEAASR